MRSGLFGGVQGLKCCLFWGELEARDEGLLFLLHGSGFRGPGLKPDVGSWVGLALAPGPLVWSLVPWTSGPWSSGLCFSLAAGRPGRGPQAAAREKLGAGLAKDIYDELESPNEGACLRHIEECVEDM